MMSRDLQRCCEAVRSAILATAWLLVYTCVVTDSCKVFYFGGVLINGMTFKVTENHCGR